MILPIFLLLSLLPQPTRIPKISITVPIEIPVGSDVIIYVRSVGTGYWALGARIPGEEIYYWPDWTPEISYHGLIGDDIALLWYPVNVPSDCDVNEIELIGWRWTGPGPPRIQTTLVVRFTDH